MSYNARVYWNQNSYGKAIRIDKNLLRGLIIVICLITPFTNWFIPFVKKTIKSDVIHRYNTRGN